jgi:hypothetical protein
MQRNLKLERKIMRKIIGLLIPILILTACNFPRAAQNQATTPPSSQQCYFTWATQPLPAVSEKVQTAIDTSGLVGVRATAEAYGENCSDSQTNQPVSFGALETDFHISAKVANLTDRNSLGNLLEKILVVLDNFPTGKIPGPQPGYISVAFQAGNDELNLMFTTTAGKSARALGLHGASLFEKLQEK